ncbi:hypothetical protein MGQ_04209 [Candida albicans P76067]|uniref:Uncharacterized protein n=1 Tax=Candida albicans P78048 TaxID=1094989 RepID=A0AB34PQG0_CANAX|nr:hypothetical protein MEU_04235 [Candida albicans P37005]KGQ91608.1 hypothetical protein MG1_04234 [Candida albicans GC75]KGR08694.1 hypothetical protein MG3_04253 [Candida albicans P78048]KGU07448.1 hypothetical protein MEY_04196 [Candida albicans 19F]KGU23419.1 hypothetical protein MG7_04225 [Candida albicans P34048]KGU27474.1 hypothetical protein MGK_04230 [Candida albicans P57055]KHC33496.1 hypothetical protein MGO_04200 [Candida albicans P76055]KHC33553.1 hypothetical protein MGQ_0420
MKFGYTLEFTWLKLSVTFSLNFHAEKERKKPPPDSSF